MPPMRAHNPGFDRFTLESAHATTIA
jgi:hypothetical protein